MHPIHHKPLIIAGPCSAETEEQVIETALQLKRTGAVSMLRAGIWKPRTRPGHFEGVGVKALPWLVRAKQLTGLPFAVEVATPRQVEDALSFEADMLWIGARTTTNPFSVKAVAAALRGTDVPVYIKNPANPDIDLWTGAVERIAAAGVSRIGLIHRGFSLPYPSRFRNPPCWDLAAAMRERHAGLPFLLDPSHMAGERGLIPTLLQYAGALQYDGLLIESHINPAEAWTDAKQQVSPAELLPLLQQIHWKKPAGRQTDTAIEDALLPLRDQINLVDNQLLELLGARMKISHEIGRVKDENGLPAVQMQRWTELLDQVCAKGSRLGLRPAFIREYFDVIHMESLTVQEEERGNR